MPDVTWNKQVWDGRYDWVSAGEEWSEMWGGSDMQWYGAILPRIHAFLPAERVLEIAPGFGRWTQFLKAQCRELHVVDLSAQCIDACRKRFVDCAHISYSVNDGKSLGMIADHSIDFCFSFDSLVHCEEDVIEAYLSQLPRKLRLNGVAFIHHSNFGNHLPKFQELKLPERVRAFLRRAGLWLRLQELGFIPYEHNRSRSMTAEKFKCIAEQHGLRCISQETINWGGRAPIDCLSTLVQQDGPWPRSNALRENCAFMKEAAELRAMSSLYGNQRLLTGSDARSTGHHTSST